VQLQYIKDLSKAYVIDNRLYEGENIITADELAENFYNVIKVIRSDHPTLYEAIFTANIFEQQKIFKNYFDLCFEREEPLLINESELLTEDGVFGAAVGLVWAAIKEIGWVLGSNWVMLIFFAFLLWSPGRRWFAKATLVTIIEIFKALGEVGKRLSHVGDVSRIAYSIVQHNAAKCLQKCEFDPKKAGISDYMYQMPQGSILRDLGRILMSIDTEEKHDCIRECYLVTLSDATKLAADLYFQCLRNTGDLSKLPLERDFSAYQALLVKTNISDSCTSFMESYAKALKAFDDSLKLIYRTEDSKRKELKQELMNDIYRMQQKSGGAPDRSSNQRPNKPFQNQNQRPGKPFNKPFQNNSNGYSRQQN